LVANLDRKLQAYQFFSAGRQRQSFDSWTKSNFTETVNLLQQALALDSSCVQAHLGLGQAYKRFSSWHLAPREAMPTARSHLLRVLELDPMSARARSMLGVIKLNFDYDWAGAEADLRRAVELNRDPVTLSGWLCHLWVQGRWEEAEAVAKENRRAEPNASWTASELAGTYYYQRKYDLMLEQVRWILERNPDNPWAHAWSFRCHLVREEFPEALSALARVNALDPSPYEIGAEGHIHGRMGRVQDALRTVAELDRLSTQRFVPKMCWALVYAGLNDWQKALYFLEQAADERSDTITLLKVDPMWDGLRAEPGFISLVQRLGLGK
jgi:serine/threonine-protein kinase